MFSAGIEMEQWLKIGQAIQSKNKLKFVLNVAHNFLKTNMILKGCDDNPGAFIANFEHER